MNTDNLIAKAEVLINASPEKVWRGLTDPEYVKSYMMGAEVKSDWKKGSQIIWKGEWQGKPFEDKGEVLEVTPNRHLSYSHISPSTAENKPDNFRTVTVTLTPSGAATQLKLTQDNNPNEKAVSESEKNWNMMLGGLKKVVENDNAASAAR